MTRPKFRPCAQCQTPNQANRKSCVACHQSLYTKKKIKEKFQTFNDQWRETVLKNRNVSRIMDSAEIAVRKLHALGYKPILFFAKEDKSSSKWVADAITLLEPTATTNNFLEKMQRAYEFLLPEGTSVPVQPDTSTEQQVFSPKEQWADEKAENLVYEPTETIAEEEPVIVLDLVPVSPPIVPSSPAFQKKKRARSTSPPASPPTLPSVSPIDQPNQHSYESPAAHAISLSQGGLFENKKRKGCRKCSRQKVFLFDSITGHRTNAGKEEVKIHWLPCSACGKIWDDTWEPASEFTHVAVPQELLPSDSKQVLP
ncbi:uncharacterized protein LOC116713812 isoform X1 [Xiphophorus hellerii]|uniref:uncharacterized protein LOC116713812 isoform X1 n=2 Tax=Xiphophorus hellerii TaxID=8084 RepID=UPI0013B37E5E|nr:uncharacterized protein LOC116713812 isoform X1 [Xiphophorus hellerii]